MMRSVAFVTVGCKLNQFETEQMRELVEGESYRTCPPDEKADVFVINTCTVTSKSDYRSRQAVRRAIRSNPDALVVVTGCYAQVAPGDVARIEGVDVILGNAEKQEILSYMALGKQPDPAVKVTPSRALTRLGTGTRLRGFGRYTRAFVKIQDGCDNRCTYCAVPGARGPSRSKNRDEVRAELEVLAGEGYREIVLTGVHLGAYGKDLSPAESLAGLLEHIAEVRGLERIRLSSIEPTDLSDELIDLMSDPALKIAPHVHVPLQSGDDEILRRMGRPYSRGFYGALIEKIADRVPRCGIGADVMVGFPGEDEAAFRNTHDLLEALPMTYLHVFSYSRRPGTPAADMEPQVDPPEKKERSRLLRELGRSKSLEFRHSLIGDTLGVLVLEARSNGLPTGLSGNYVKAFFDRAVPTNTMMACTALDLGGGGLRVFPKESR